MSSPLRSFCYVPAGLTVALLALSPAAAQAHLITGMTAQLLFVGATLPALAALIVSFYCWRKQETRTAWVSLVVGGLPPVIFAGLYAMNGPWPAPVDLSTNLENPPEFATISAPHAYSDAEKTRIREVAPDLIAGLVPGTTDAVFRRCLEVERQRSQVHLSRIDQDQWTLEGDEPRGIFRVLDHFVIRLSPLEGRVQVDMRSLGRGPLPDWGENADRIRQLLVAVQAVPAS